MTRHAYRWVMLGILVLLPQCDWTGTGGTNNDEYPEITVDFVPESPVVLTTSFKYNTGTYDGSGNLIYKDILPSWFKIDASISSVSAEWTVAIALVTVDFDGVGSCTYGPSDVPATNSLYNSGFVMRLSPIDGTTPVQTASVTIFCSGLNMAEPYVYKGLVTFEGALLDANGDAKSRFKKTKAITTK